MRFEKRDTTRARPHPKSRQAVEARDPQRAASMTLPDGALKPRSRPHSRARPLAHKCHPDGRARSDASLDRIPELRAVDDPAAVLAETFSDVAERHVDGVARHMSAFPRLGHHRLVRDELAVMLQQHAQAVERPQPEPDLDPLTRQAGRAGVEQKRAKECSMEAKFCKFLTFFVPPARAACGPIGRSTLEVNPACLPTGPSTTEKKVRF